MIPQADFNDVVIVMFVLYVTLGIKVSAGKLTLWSHYGVYICGFSGKCLGKFKIDCCDI